MPTWKIVFMVCVVILGIAVSVVITIVALRNAKKKEEDTLKKKKEEIFGRLRNEVHLAFGVELETINENGTRDEIVRLVNLLAYETALVCVVEDTGRRNRSLHPSQHDNAYFAKVKWAEKRKLAIQICPELKDRMPHFSEFEPLKSYREEHLRDKTTRATR